MAFELKSDAFADGEKIPGRYTHEGENLSPPLSWSGAPEDTRDFGLIMEDPDAPTGTFRHWGLYHIAGGRTLLPEAVEAGAKTEDLGYCINDFGELKYDGPQPPEGDPPHRYDFRLAALDVERITEAPKMKVAEKWHAAQPHILAVAELTGTYRR
ncbi:MAG TPA: YbhB/YbcL family Raf kinase inhibitor-like protein [Alphaproteobacteria bacterium]|nr:YbhB/YbcL family Raf kinase inhibitor-like protein [Alphaproteobacteria bacterium]